MQQTINIKFLKCIIFPKSKPIHNHSHSLFRYLIKNWQEQQIKQVNRNKCKKNTPKKQKCLCTLGDSSVNHSCKKLWANDSQMHIIITWRRNRRHLFRFPIGNRLRQRLILILILRLLDSPRWELCRVVSYRMEISGWIASLCGVWSVGVHWLIHCGSFKKDN